MLLHVLTSSYIIMYIKRRLIKFVNVVSCLNNIKTGLYLVLEDTI